ncbi:MAG: hypothetical protein AAGF47_03765 [Planctomycetota bacterium]
MTDIGAMRGLAGEVIAAFGVPVRIERTRPVGDLRPQQAFDVDTGFSSVDQDASFDTTMTMPMPDATPGFGPGDVSAGSGTIVVGQATAGVYFGPSKRDTITLLDGPQAGRRYTVDRVESRSLGAALVLDYSVASGGPGTAGAGTEAG